MKLVRLIKMCLNETYSKVRIGHICGNFLFEYELKQGDALTPLLLNLAVEYAIRKVQENQLRLKLNGIHQLVVYADMNLLGDNIDAMKKNTETLIEASKGAGLEVNTEKTNKSTKHTNALCGQNAEFYDVKSGGTYSNRCTLDG
jgi:hypothetical protein